MRTSLRKCLATEDADSVSLKREPTRICLVSNNIFTPYRSNPGLFTQQTTFCGKVLLVPPFLCSFFLLFILWNVFDATQEILYPRRKVFLDAILVQVVRTVSYVIRVLPYAPWAALPTRYKWCTRHLMARAVLCIDSKFWRQFIIIEYMLLLSM